MSIRVGYNSFVAQSSCNDLFTPKLCAEQTPYDTAFLDQTNERWDLPGIMNAGDEGFKGLLSWLENFPFSKGEPASSTSPTYPSISGTSFSSGNVAMNNVLSTQMLITAPDTTDTDTMLPKSPTPILSPFVPSSYEDDIHAPPTNPEVQLVPPVKVNAGGDLAWMQDKELAFSSRLLFEGTETNTSGYLNAVKDISSVRASQSSRQPDPSASVSGPPSLGLTEERYTRVGPKLFRCSVCPQACQTRRDIRRHLVTVHCDKKFVCSDCGTKFTRFDSLCRHQKAKICQPKPAGRRRRKMHRNRDRQLHHRLSSRSNNRSFARASPLS